MVKNRNRIEKLMDEFCPGGVVFKELKDIFDIRDGYTPRTTKMGYWSNGTIPGFRMEDIRINFSSSQYSFVWFHKTTKEFACVTRTEYELVLKCKEIGSYYNVIELVKQVTPDPPKTFTSKVKFLLFLGKTDIFGNYYIQVSQIFANRCISGGNPDIIGKNRAILQYDDITLIADKEFKEKHFSLPHRMEKQKRI